MSVFQRLHPHAYLERFLAEGVRPDGRAPRAWRDVSVNVGACHPRRPPSAHPRRLRVHRRRVRPRAHGQDPRRVWRQGRDRRARAGRARARLPRCAQVACVDPALTRNSPQHRPPGDLLAQVQAWSTVRGGTGPLREAQRRPRQVGLALFVQHHAIDDFRSNLLPLDTLCIASGRAAWCLYVDATCLNYDGNAFDAALVAIMAALGNSAYSSSYTRST
jgi:exosome complex component RRP43